MENFNIFFNKNMIELLNCNLNNYKFTENNINNIKQDLIKYYESIKNELNYESVPTLEDWIGPGDGVYPNIHAHHKPLIHWIKKYNVKQSLDCGAGCGMLSKYIYATNNNIDINCIENSSIHLSQLSENFNTRTHIIKPDIKVPATVNKGTLNKLNLEDNSYEFVFTCTVLMHIPFIPAIASICELARVSSKYICHIENRNDVINAIVKGNTELPEELLCIDYKKIYDILGYDIIEFNYGAHPGTEECKFVYLLAKKR